MGAALAVGKYDPLRSHLADLSIDASTMSFAEIERVLGFPLPASARRYPAWWSNESEGSHSHARAWMEAGFRTERLDLNAATVTFRRAAARVRSDVSETGTPDVTAVVEGEPPSGGDATDSPKPRRARGWLRRTQRPAAKGARRVGLVGCVKAKTSRAAPAGELYTSTLFEGRRSHVESTCDEWWILSAKHGLVHPDEVLAPYDLAMKDLGRPERRAWAADVLRALDERLELSAGDVVEIHAGAEYRDFGLERGLRERGMRVENPTEAMPIGVQLSYYQSSSRQRRS